LLTVFLLFAVPPIASDIHEFARSLPQNLARLNDRIKGLPYGSRVNFDTLSGVAGTLIGGVPGLITGAANAIVAIATVVILTAYLILDGKNVFQWAMSLVALEERRRLEGALRRAGCRMRNWLVGQVLLMLILGSSSAVVFGMLHLRYFVALAVFAGVANVVPMLGPIVTVVLASLVAALDSFSKVLGVLIFYLVYQQIENAFLTPRIMQSQVQLSATAVVVALLIGGELAGVAGALVAVPSAVLVSVLADEYLVKKS
jgi:predicted PurR-regulated permease PerM